MCAVLVLHHGFFRVKVSPIVYTCAVIVLEHTFPLEVAVGSRRSQTRVAQYQFP
jgi:hypothetical protein